MASPKMKNKSFKKIRDNIKAKKKSYKKLEEVKNGPNTIQ